MTRASLLIALTMLTTVPCGSKQVGPPTLPPPGGEPPPVARNQFSDSVPAEDIIPIAEFFAPARQRIGECGGFRLLTTYPSGKGNRRHPELLLQRDGFLIAASKGIEAGSQAETLWVSITGPDGRTSAVTATGESVLVEAHVQGNSLATGMAGRNSRTLRSLLDGQFHHYPAMGVLKLDDRTKGIPLKLYHSSGSSPKEFHAGFDSKGETLRSFTMSSPNDTSFDSYEFTSDAAGMPTRIVATQYSDYSRSIGEPYVIYMIDELPARESRQELEVSYDCGPLRALWRDLEPLAKAAAETPMTEEQAREVVRLVDQALMR